MKNYIITYLLVSSMLVPTISAAPDYIGVDDDVEIIWKITKNDTALENWNNTGGNDFYNLTKYDQNIILVRILTTSVSNEYAPSTAISPETGLSYDVQFGLVNFTSYFGYVEDYSLAVWYNENDHYYPVFDDVNTNSTYVALKIWYQYWFYQSIFSTNLDLSELASNFHDFLDAQINTTTVSVVPSENSGYRNINTTVEYDNMDGNFSLNICLDNDGIVHNIAYKNNGTTMVSINQVFYDDFERDPVPNENNGGGEEDDQYDDIGEVRRFFFLIGAIGVVTALFYVAMTVVRKKDK